MHFPIIAPQPDRHKPPKITGRHGGSFTTTTPRPETSPAEVAPGSALVECRAHNVVVVWLIGECFQSAGVVGHFQQIAPCTGSHHDLGMGRALLRFRDTFQPSSRPHHSIRSSRTDETPCKKSSGGSNATKTGCTPRRYASRVGAENVKTRP